MSVAYYLVPKNEIDGFDPGVDGKSLASVDEDFLLDLAQALGVEPLQAFLSGDPAAFDDFGMDDESGEGASEAEWFPAAEGLRTVRAMLAHLRATPDAVPLPGVIEDLEDFERVLRRLDAEDVEFHIAVDY